MMTQRGPLIRAHCKANICGMSVGTNHHRNPSLMRTETNKNIVLEWPISRQRSDDDVNQWTSLNAPQTTNTISRSQEMFANGCRTHQLNWMVSSSSMWELTAHELTAVLMQKKVNFTQPTQHNTNKTHQLITPLVWVRLVRLIPRITANSLSKIYCFLIVSLSSHPSFARSRALTQKKGSMIAHSIFFLQSFHP